MVKRREYFRIQKFAKRYDQQTGKFIIDIRYETATKITPRTIAVAEAFGLGIDQQRKFTIYDNVELKIGPTDIVYLTGDSGSGKSILLKALEKDIKQDIAQSVVNMAEVQLDPEKPLIDTVGKTFSQGLELLSKVGLNDAFLFVRRYRELSDGQRYRYRIAKMIESKAEWWIFDEFCATLDRDTAKIVAFNVQKLARQLHKTVLAATTHSDLFEDLTPSVHIHKRFGKEITIHYYSNQPAKQCSLIKQMYVAEGTIKDWKAVASFHYRSHKIAFRDKIFTLHKGKEVCGVIVYARPTAACFGRSRVFKPKDMTELNAKLSRIARVVVHPKYRTIGAGVKLVRESMPKCGKPLVETIAVMAMYNPFFERAGMTKVCETVPGKQVVMAVGELEKLGFKTYMLGVATYNERTLKDQISDVLSILRKMRYPYNRRIAGSHGNFTLQDWENWLIGVDIYDLANALTRLAQLNQVKVYLFWHE